MKNPAIELRAEQERLRAEYENQPVRAFAEHWKPDSALKLTVADLVFLRSMRILAP